MVQPLTISIIQKHLESDRLFRERRHNQWTMNYELARDTVIVNRLTQRQSVNVPYMKKTLKTYLTQTNWPVDNYYENQANDKQSELYLNEYWTQCAERLRLDILEEVDRKQEWLYGRSFAKLNIIDGWFHMEVIDPQDVLLDRFMNPWDLQSGRRITHTGIYRTLSDCERNPLYDKAAIERLKIFFATKQGLVIAGQNALIAADKAKRLLDLGVPDVLMPLLGETYVELNEMQVKVWDDEKKEDVVMVVVTANANEILMQKPLREILGINMFSWASWAGDVERTDCWSDGGADSVRQLNLVANARWSQKVENGTLANYGMYFYDSTAKEGWTPVGYDPAPFGFYPLPGKPQDVLQPVTVPTMPDVFKELDWIDKEIQGVSGATAIEQGQDDPNAPGAAQTAQEIQILASKAKERASNISKYHKRYWEDIGRIFVELVQANGKDMAQPKLYKKSAKGQYYPKTLNLAETYSKEGYKVKVGSKADKESDSLQTIQKMKVAVTDFPNNAPLQKIYKQKVLDWMGLTPEETKEVMNFDDQQASMMMQAGPGKPTPMPPVAPKIAGAPHFPMPSRPIAQPANA
jgi:hypothetical protein